MGRQRPRPTITPEILLRAYAMGLFPMAEGADDPSLFWLDPEMRGIFPLDGMAVSRSLARTVRRDRFAVAVDRDFGAVIAACAEATEGRPDTWINGEIRSLYGRLFAMGYAHTVEAYEGEALVGGLYGVALGGRSSANPCSTGARTRRRCACSTSPHGCASAATTCSTRSS